jgi:hypothetical protein
VKKSNVADPDLGSGALLIPGSGSELGFFPDSGSPYNISERLVTIFGIFNSLSIGSQLDQKSFCTCSRIGVVGYGIQDKKKSGSGISIPDPQHRKSVIDVCK